MLHLLTSCALSIKTRHLIPVLAPLRLEYTHQRRHMSSDLSSDLKMLINGRLVPAEDGKTTGVINPATGRVFVRVPDASRRDLDHAVAAGRNAFASWRKTPFEQRANCLAKFAAALKARSSEFAEVLTKEQGKPLMFAMGEVMSCVNKCIDLGKEDLLKPTVVNATKKGRVEVHYLPRGVVGGITPWNFPMSMAANKVFPAVITGNTIVLKPSPYTPVTTIMMGQIAQKCFPPGVVNIVSGGNELGKWIVAHPDVAHITFTGSEATGRHIMAEASKSIKKVTLELGGNDAAIVLPGTDIRVAAPKIFQGAAFNSGQTCVCIKRVYVHESQYEDMVRAIGAAATSASVGDGMQKGTMYGPMNNQMQLSRVEELVADAVATGGRLVAGGERFSTGIPGQENGYFYKPTIIADVTDDTRLVKEEQFGLALPILKYKNVAEAVKRANDSKYGLGGSVWGPDAERAAEVALELECGMSWVNQHLSGTDSAPFGGWKSSGIGREGGGVIGLREFVEPKSLFVKALKGKL